MATDDPAPKRKGKTNPIIFVFLGLLILSLGGFSITSFGSGRQTLGTVGGREISLTDYGRALRQELQALSQQFGQTIGMEQAQALGLDAQVRGRLVAAAAVDNEADRIGLSVGDDRVAREITALQSFHGLDGKFDPAIYRQVLDQNNLTVAEFEARMRSDLARTLLQGAVGSGFTAPAALTDTLFVWVSERRGLSLLQLGEADLTAPVPEPDEAALRAFHEANVALFTRPEARQVTYAALLPADIAAGMPVEEADLRALYEARIDEFVTPERRLAERLVFPDEAAAAAARARLDAGESFDALVAERGLALADIDLGDVTEADLGAAGAGVFALTEPGIAGPLPSDLGPALYRMNGILAATETTFDAARDALALELQTEEARNDITGRLEALDDKLAGGATLEDLAREDALTLRQIVLTPDTDDPLAGYPEFRQAAEAATTEDFPAFILLDDGGIAALRLDAILPAAPIPFDEALSEVEAAWRADALARALADRAIAIKAEVEAGAPLGGFGILAVTPALARNGTLAGAPEAAVAAAFQMQPGDLRVIEAPGFTGILQLDAITPGDSAADASVAMQGAIAAQAEQAMSEDAFQLFTNAMTTQAGIFLDQAAIAAVHAQFP
jgi:peptidyl-prolyl cis-trans isomerase D